MRYNQFRKQGLFVGSGVMEAGCKSLIGQRMKQSGMEWSVRGANAIGCGSFRTGGFWRNLGRDCNPTPLFLIYEHGTGPRSGTRFYIVQEFAVITLVSNPWISLPASATIAR